MARTLTTTARKAIYAAQTGEAFLVLLTLHQASMVSPIRVCSGGMDLTSRGDLFAFFPFEVAMPAESEDSVPSVQLRICNVDRSIVTHIRQITGPMTVRLEVVLASSPDTVEAGPFDFTLRDVTYDAELVEGDLFYEDVLNEPYPADAFTPSRTPGIF